jgi:molybdate transport system ATP-binding protein
VAELVAELAFARADFSLAVTLRCPPGITCIMGPSGAGKSTILDLLAGLLVPARGRVVLGEEVWFDRDKAIAVPVHHRQIAYVFQGLGLFPHMTALRNVAYGMRGSPRAERLAKARELLERLGVGALAERKPGTFSGGEAQRVALARALGCSPKLVLLDEPFSALDRELRTQLTALVRELASELAVPVIHVTHSLAEARLLADRVILLERGSILAEGGPELLVASD